MSKIDDLIKQATGFLQEEAGFISTLQSYLNAHGFKLDVDGVAGPRTKDAWDKFSGTIAPTPTRPIPPPPPCTVTAPYGITMTLMTIFGLNWDGSDDKGDEDSSGKPLKGAWGSETHNKGIVGCALPITLCKETFGGTAADDIKGCTVQVYSQVTQKTVNADIVDLGPSAYTHRLIDGTYGLHQALGHLEYGKEQYGELYSKWPAGFHVAYWINGPDGKAIQIKGVDFAGGRIIGS